jgi:hypothetical protein
MLNATTFTQETFHCEVRKENVFRTPAQILNIWLSLVLNTFCSDVECCIIYYQ